MYVQARLEQLGVVVEGRVHTSRLKTRLMSVFPDLKAHSQRKGIVLTFDDDVGSALNRACNYDDDATRAAEVVRKK